MTTILVVEDEELVRMAVVATLSEDYEIIEAANGHEAIQHLESTAQIDLVFSDIVMPGGINGAEVATRTRQLRPGTKVLLTSGYTRQDLTAHQIDPSLTLLRKPYRIAELLAQVATTLSEPFPA